MHRITLLDQLKSYSQSSYVTQEELEVIQQFITFISCNHNCFERHNVGHITGSVWIVNPTKTHTLLTHHKKLDMWLQLGGHCDGDSNVIAVSLKEAVEESGIEQFQLLSHSIFDIDIHPIPNACAYHYDVRFLVQAQHDQFVISDESNDLRWVPFNEIHNYSQHRSILRMNEKFLRHFK